MVNALLTINRSDMWGRIISRIRDTYVTDNYSSVEIDGVLYQQPLFKLESKALLNRHLKRILDLFISIVALVILLPVLVLVALLIKLQDRGDCFFKQSRVGFDGEEFYCLKFRTMVLGADVKLSELLKNDFSAAEEWKRTQKLKNDPRVTYLGEFLRRTSLDELPQLWNVIRGDMSLVGPRPIVRNEATKYGFYLPYYTSVLPGITGLWQTSGRSDTSYEERVLLDVEYANSNTLIGDLKILFKTVPIVILSGGAY